MNWFTAKTGEAVKPGAPAGGRDDLAIDPSRCLRLRFGGSGCRGCIDACPRGAIAVADTLEVDGGACTGCLLCTTACPAGALESAGDFSASLLQLSKVAEPVLGCTRTRDTSHATVACLGGLSDEHLVGLNCFLSGTVTLNLTACAGCLNEDAVGKLRQRVAGLVEDGLLPEAGVQMAQAPGSLRRQEETVNRRSFFKSLRRSVLLSAAIAANGFEQKKDGRDRNSSYSEKRLPARRELLNGAREFLTPQEIRRVEARFDWQVTFSDCCTRCQGCVAICPAGALLNVGTGEAPRLDSSLCTGCGLCREFCLDGALQLSRCE